MSFLDYENPILGKLSDEIESDIPQVDIDTENLSNFNSVKFLEMFRKRINMEHFKYLVDIPDFNDLKYIEKVISTIIKEYSLNYLRFYLDTEKYDINKLTNELIKSIIYLKINLVKYIETDQIDKEIKYEDLVKFLEDTKAPKLFLDCIKYIDKESYIKFINRIFLEIKLEYLE